MTALIFTGLWFLLPASFAVLVACGVYLLLAQLLGEALDTLGVFTMAIVSVLLLSVHAIVSNAVVNSFFRGLPYDFIENPSPLGHIVGISFFLLALIVVIEALIIKLVEYRSTK